DLVTVMTTSRLGLPDQSAGQPSTVRIPGPRSDDQIGIVA
ncbi:MAG: hypothetical protein QOC85_1946, partial [Streptomyces sp.]|nr:hypothetical protein [Streptomyces sp.]